MGKSPCCRDSIPEMKSLGRVGERLTFRVRGAQIHILGEWGSDSDFGWVGLRLISWVGGAQIDILGGWGTDIESAMSPSTSQSPSTPIHLVQW